MGTERRPLKQSKTQFSMDKRRCYKWKHEIVGIGFQDHLSTHCFKDVRLCLLAATKARAKCFSLPNLQNRIVLFIITVSSNWEAPATTVSGCNFIPVFHGRTPWLSGNHGVLTVSQRKRQIQDTSSAAVDGQLLQTAALFTSKPQTLQKVLLLAYGFNNEYWRQNAEKTSSILRRCE